jgi:formylglycine-generating enzyme required for sulfatase activity
MQEPEYSAPPDHFPPRLASLGYRAMFLNGAEVILPPLCAVAAGAFLMGSDKGAEPQAYNGESPQQRLTLAAFQIGKYPVTVAEYACFVRAGHGEPTNWQWQLTKLDHPEAVLKH